MNSTGRRDFAFLCAVSLLMSALSVIVSGCNGGGGPPSPPSPRVTVCGQNFSQTDFETFMNGNLVIVASYNAKGSSSAKIIQSLIFGMLFNGINFSDLASYSISFDNSTSTYTVGNGTASVSFTLYVTEDFTDSSGSTIAAGSPLPTNVFAMDSYVTNVGVNVSVGGSILHPTVSYSYSYDHGPLWALLSSTAVSISGSSVSDLRLSLPSLNTSILGISVNSQNTYTGTAPYIQDTIKLDMTTTDISLTDASAQFQAGDFGFSYAGTSYDSAFFGIEQEITGSMFYMTPGSTGWTWNGTYQSTVTNSNLNMTLYQSGTVSQAAANTTTYYCDGARTDEIGVATDNLQLTGGVFIFTNGDSFNYLLD